MKGFFTLIILLLLSFNSLIAQEKFIEHTIVKGETVYSISKKYGVTIGAIYELNPGATDIIYPGETLRIPEVNSTSPTQNDSSANTSDFIAYEVKRGETKFGLSKRFGVSIAMLEQQNPQIVNMLQAGHILKIDKTLNIKPNATNSNEHVVAKGETLWGISNQYNVPLNTLISANSAELSEFLQIGQRLVIPDKNTITRPSPEGEYLVKRGETKYGLAKQFNLSIAELEAKNPQIIPMLMAGQTLDVSPTTEINKTSDAVANVEEKPELQKDALDKKDEVIETIDTEQNINSPGKNTEEAYVNYVIQPQETLYSLSKKADLTIGELINLNPKLLVAVKKGDTIKMPLVSNEDLGASKIVNIDTKNTTALPIFTKNTSLLSNLDFSEKNGIYFYLPFNDKEYNSSRYRQKSANRELQKYFDFYEGAQMAIDSARALNLKFEVTLIEKKDERKSNFEIIVDDANTENAIVVPYLEKNTPYPEIVSTKNVPIIDVESYITAQPNATVYESIPSEQFQKTKTLNYLARKKNANVIAVSALEESKNKSLILKTIPDVTFLKVDKAGFFDDTKLNESLKKGQVNYVILDSQQTIVFLNTTTSLMGRLSEYDIQLVLINPELLKKQNEASKMRYKILKLIYPTLALKQDTKDLKYFERNYEQLHETSPSINAIMGFDVTLDVLLRLSQKASFETSVNTISNSEQTQLKFDYQKKDSSNYSNIGVYIMQYDAVDGAVRIE